MNTILSWYALMHFFLVPAWTIQEGRTCGVDTMGWYITNSVFINQAYICDWLSEKDTKFVKWHEAWHFIWRHKLSEVQRAKWVSIHNHSKVFVSEYARTSPEEDFAESIASIFTTGNKPNKNRLFFIKKLDIDTKQNTICNQYLQLC